MFSTTVIPLALIKLNINVNNAKAVKTEKNNISNVNFSRHVKLMFTYTV